MPHSSQKCSHDALSLRLIERRLAERNISIYQLCRDLETTRFSLTLCRRAGCPGCETILPSFALNHSEWFTWRKKVTQKCRTAVDSAWRRTKDSLKKCHSQLDAKEVDDIIQNAKDKAQFSGYTLCVLFTWLLKLTFFRKDGVVYFRMTCPCGYVIETPLSTSGEKGTFSEIEFVHKAPIDGFFKKGEPVQDGHLIAQHAGNVVPVCETCHTFLDTKSRSPAAVSERGLLHDVWDMMAKGDVVDGKL